MSFVFLPKVAAAATAAATTPAAAATTTSAAASAAIRNECQCLPRWRQKLGSRPTIFSFFWHDFVCSKGLRFQLEVLIKFNWIKTLAKAAAALQLRGPSKVPVWCNSTDVDSNHVESQGARHKNPSRAICCGKH